MKAGASVNAPSAKRCGLTALPAAVGKEHHIALKMLLKAELTRWFHLLRTKDVLKKHGRWLRIYGGDGTAFEMLLKGSAL